MDITQQLTAIAKAMGCSYTLKGEPIAFEKVFSPSGLLPALMRRADQLSTFCLGYSLGANYEKSESAVLQAVVQMDATTPTVLRLLCITDVLYEFMQQASNPNAISLDELMND